MLCKFEFQLFKITSSHFVYNGYYPLLQITLSIYRAGADLDTLDECGRTPMHYACFKGFVEIAEELIK